MPSPFPAPILQPLNDLPIATQKGSRSTRNPHLVYNFLSYYRLSLFHFTFVSILSFVSTPQSTSKAFSHPGLKHAMTEEMNALYSNGTCELVTLPSGKSAICC